MTGYSSGAWLVEFGASSAPARLFVIPHAGAGAAVVRPWEGILGGRVLVSAIRLPGRESRILEAPMRDAGTLVAEVATAVAPRIDRPYGILGLCSGALVAFELARELVRRHVRPPDVLFPVAQAAPHIGLRATTLHDSPRATLIAELRQLGGTPDAILDNDEMMNLLEPALRADFELAETYVYEPSASVLDHVSVIVGSHDPFLRIDDAFAWRQHSAGKFTFRELDAAHFFATDASVASFVVSDLCHA